MWRDGEGKRARTGELQGTPQDLHISCEKRLKPKAHLVGNRGRRPQACGTIEAWSTGAIMAGFSLPGRSNSIRRSNALERI